MYLYEGASCHFNTLDISPREKLITLVKMTHSKREVFLTIPIQKALLQPLQTKRYTHYLKKNVILNIFLLLCLNNDSVMSALHGSQESSIDILVDELG